MKTKVENMNIDNVFIYVQCTHPSGIVGSFASKNGKFTNIYKDLYQLFASQEYKDLKK